MDLVHGLRGKYHRGEGKSGGDEVWCSDTTQSERNQEARAEKNYVKRLGRDEAWTGGPKRKKVRFPQGIGAVTMLRTAVLKVSTLSTLFSSSVSG